VPAARVDPVTATRAPIWGASNRPGLWQAASVKRLASNSSNFICESPDDFSLQLSTPYPLFVSYLLPPCRYSAHVPEMLKGALNNPIVLALALAAVVLAYAVYEIVY
jgi:hypothetical protein